MARPTLILVLCAVALLAAGCAPTIAELKARLDEAPAIRVVYRGGVVVTQFDRRFSVETTTPGEYRALGTTVTAALRERLGLARVADSAVPSRAGWLEAQVFVNGGYDCEGTGPDYECSLLMQTYLVFRAGPEGRVVGPSNVVGQVWYGRHPVHWGTGGAAAGSPELLQFDRAIRREIPATIILEPLVSATEEGLTDFLNRVHAAGG